MHNYSLERSADRELQRNDGGASARVTSSELSLLGLYGLRIAYLILAVGLGIYMWPAVIHHTSSLAASGGVRLSLLAGIGALAVMGLRYPVQMLPLLLFEVSWKAIYLIAFALPLWVTGQLTAGMQEDVNSILAVVILLPLIPWGYVFKHYVMKRGERWK